MTSYIYGEDQINLRLLMVSGKTKEFLFSSRHTAQDVTNYVYENWPQDWHENEKPESNILRLIYQGKFLHGNCQLQALNLPRGRSIVMHLVPRQNLSGPPAQDSNKRKKSRSNHCCTVS